MLENVGSTLSDPVGVPPQPAARVASDIAAATKGSRRNVARGSRFGRMVLREIVGHRRYT